MELNRQERRTGWTRELAVWPAQQQDEDGVPASADEQEQQGEELASDEQEHQKQGLREQCAWP